MKRHLLALDQLISRVGVVLLPLVLLLMRLEIGRAFFLSGLTKIQDWSTTIALFTDEYHVPLLPPAVAAPLATAGELLLPVLLVTGLMSRFAASGLFVLNLMAVISYWHGLTGPQGQWTSGLFDHWQWGLMLLVLVSSGAGKLSVDHCWLNRGSR
ncbi:DoxX family protein [Leeia oryzae]|uniref:DoxX family protein n=1 Tax=Leeia oryzae TaxID=356662 RepID=UPI000360AFF9|nr:DoxX family protein [Leeia oryzae]